MSAGSLAARVGRALGREVASLRPLGGGCIAEVRLATLGDGARVVVKAAEAGPGDGGAAGLALEQAMLEDLAADGALPVPRVLHGAPDLLILEYIEHDGGAPSATAQQDAAERLATLHTRPRPRFGYAYDTVIGRLPQPNPPAERWVPFFAEHRLLHMARRGHAEGAVPTRLLARLEALSGRLGRYLEEPAHPALLHGDLWTGNVLCRDGRLVGVIDPALYCGHPEIELAFTTLFGTFGPPFFERYRERAAFDAAGFLELRRDLYNLYPLLVHVRHFGAGYIPPIEGLLSRLGL